MRTKYTLLVALALAVVFAIALWRGREPNGLVRFEDNAFEGYTLFAPMRSTTTYLVNMRGDVVHKWKGEHPPGQAVYLLDNGRLLKCAHPPGQRHFHGGGLGGLIREYDWDGRPVWEFSYSDDKHCQHHDIEPLPNGNVLVLASEKKSKAEAIAAGRDPATVGREGLWPDHVIEVKPEGGRGGRIVWEWHVWDHLIQDHDAAKENYGPVAEHPERIDVNYTSASSRLSREQRERLESLGYLQASPRGRPRDSRPDWNHTNSIDYNAELDQIILSVLAFNEVWIIDHGTTTKEAAGHAGGKHGKGGDLLYRWGNPQAYRAGTAEDQQLFAQHDARWIPRGFPGAGHVLIFNNGRGRPNGDYSSVDEIVVPTGAAGGYARETGSAFDPARPIWSYSSPGKSDFFAGHISGAHRLPNGNTLVCSGEKGRLFEVRPDGKVVWEYENPFGGEIGPPPGPPQGAGPPRRPPGPQGKRPGGPGSDRSGSQRSDRPSPPGGPRGPRGGPPGGQDEENAIFRATRLAPDHPGLQGRDLPPAS